MINYHIISIHDFVQTHTSWMMPVSILIRMPAIYILRRERVIRSVFVHVPVPGRAGVFTRRRKPLGSSAEQTEGLRLGRADFCVGKTGHIFCREVSAAGKTFMREDDHSLSLDRVPRQFSPIRAKKPVYTKISDGSRRVFYILESSSINYLKKRRWYYYVNWNWRKFNRLFWFCKR